MQPSKTTVTGLFSSPYQYQVPIFQRGYVWTLEKQVVPLWADIQDRADARMEYDKAQQSVGADALKPLQKHFLGSVVLTSTGKSQFGRVPAYEVIDGQQRSTTLQLLLVAFSLAAQQLEDDQLPKMLEVLIKNSGSFTVATDYHKVWPTQAGQDEMRFLYSVQTVEQVCAAYPARNGRYKIERPLMVQTFLYLYFACLAYLQGIDLGGTGEADEHTPSDELVRRIRSSNEVAALESKTEFDAERAQALYMALAENIEIMMLVLDQGIDDPQVIFETLNARGEPLLASDLIRNFVFLEAARNDLPVGELYNTFWSRFDLASAGEKGSTSNRYWAQKERQGRLTYPRIDLFFYNYTILRSQEPTLVGHVFEAFKSWWQKGPRDLKAELQRIVTASNHFKQLVSPEGTGYLAEFARLIEALDVSTITPVYLALRERLKDDSEELRQALGDLASYLTRRSVCGLPTNAYNRFFMRVLQAIVAAPDAPHLVMRKVLLEAKSESELWPSDQAFRDKWLHRPIYSEMKPARVCGILRALEYAARGRMQGSNHVPLRADLSIEHVLPQSWEEVPAWQIPNMTADQRQLRGGALHQCGNLTLLTLPLNSSVSNGPFEDWTDPEGRPVLGKHSRLKESALLMNTYFSKESLDKWNESEIASRAEALFQAALHVWSRPAAGHIEPTVVAEALSGNLNQAAKSKPRPLPA